MNPLLEQFLSEARDLLQGVGEKLMQLEAAPADAELMTALFRMVHTLKGNSGLFESPEMTRVLHAGEDLMDAVRKGRVVYSQELADRLLDAMDFVGMLCDEIETQGVAAPHVADATRLAKSLRELMVGVDGPFAAEPPEAPVADSPLGAFGAFAGSTQELAAIDEAQRMALYRSVVNGATLYWLVYSPDVECFFRGHDPLLQVRRTPELRWGTIRARKSWPALQELDAYQCELDFLLLTAASPEQLEEHYRYMAEQVDISAVGVHALVIPLGSLGDEPPREAFVVEALAQLAAGDGDALARAARDMLGRCSATSWLASALRWLLQVLALEPGQHAAIAALIDAVRLLRAPQWNTTSPVQTTAVGADAIATLDTTALDAVVDMQREVFALPMQAAWELGRARAAVTSLAGCLQAAGDPAAIAGLQAAASAAIAASTPAPLLAWLNTRFPPRPLAELPIPGDARRGDRGAVQAGTAESPLGGHEPRPATVSPGGPEPDGEPRAVRRAEETASRPRSLKVDQAKIDRLMNLIGEMVVSKNALPYLAARAEAVFGSRELGREIKTQYAVINRIAEEMQDAIMQVSMLPVSFVFQRFPRLVRDTARKLGKEVVLVLEGEDTEADKTIIESLADPLVHIVRNSLDHGFELPDARLAAGKPAAGTLTIRASQQSDRVVIEVSDDGKGIDPGVIKRKAHENGLIDEATLQRISDQDALNLIFAAGFSTADVVSDLSGRGVGMDVVKTAVEKVHGTVVLHSEVGHGTRIVLSLPLSMAITNVMIIESDGQTFGVPMDSVVETVRVARSAVHTIKHSLAIVLRGRVVPLKSINALLGLDAPPLANAEDELAVLVVRVGDESMGLLVDDFQATVDIILKPMTGVLAGLPIYSGTALMGDGSVLVILNLREML